MVVVCDSVTYTSVLLLLWRCFGNSYQQVNVIALHSVITEAVANSTFYLSNE